MLQPSELVYLLTATTRYSIGESTPSRPHPKAKEIGLLSDGGVTGAPYGAPIHTAATAQ